jgi:ssRNA-specific RNase YbeY (16S rRNA maturation enzyme)
MINIITSSRYQIDRKKIKSVLNDYLNIKGITTDYIFNIVFAGRNKMKSISQKYKQENQILPVLSFSYHQDKPPVGEIFICYPLAILLAAERNKKVDDTIINLIKHGVDNLLK